MNGNGWRTDEELESYVSYRQADFNSGLSKCPRCGCHYIEWTNSRDLNVLDWRIECARCELSTFRVETVAFHEGDGLSDSERKELHKRDFDSAKKKYNGWCKTNPKSYADERW